MPGKSIAALLILLINLPFLTVASNPDSTSSSIIGTSDTLNFDQLYGDEKESAAIMDILDSLVSLNFFTNTTFTADTAELNTYHFPPNTVPEYSDSIVQARIEEMNITSLIELTYNRQVKSYIDVYTVNKRELASRVLGLAQVYFPLFEEQLDKYNMPLELKYLAVVESALNPIANSRAGAKGLWQFMYGTGKLYGLYVNSLVDDRFDPYKATDAACRHLKDLYNIYGNWSLAMAAYNSGAGNVNKAIRRAGGVKSYWAVWPYLPRETRGYVPAFIAVMYMMNYPAEHNLYPIHPGILAEEIDSVTVNDVLSFDQISEFLDISPEVIKFLNPTYKMGIIPSTEKKKYILRLPREDVARYIDGEQELYAFKTEKGIEKEKLLTEIKKAEERNIHVVRSGENLGLIAQRYHCSVSSLRSWNNLKGNTIYPGQKLVVYAHGQTPSVSVQPTTKTTDINSRDKDYHIVKSGENLGLIASKYNCSISDLKAWNNLNSNTIQPNQKLTVYPPKEPMKETTVAKEDGNKDGMHYVYHTVRKGDTLWDIAKLYEGVSVEQIKQLNNISNSKRLKPGQKLKVATKG